MSPEQFVLRFTRAKRRRSLKYRLALRQNAKTVALAQAGASLGVFVKTVCSAKSTAPARANDAEELDRIGDALQLTRALLFGDEEPRNLALDVHRDEHRARLGGGLNASGDIRRVAKHFACRFHYDRPAFDPDASRKFGRAFAAVLGVDLRQRGRAGPARKRP